MAVWLEHCTAEFDCPLKLAATEQFMKTNGATFDEATGLLGYQHGVDFIFSKEVEILER